MSSPTATGTFQATPFAHVLVYARNKRLTGRVTIEAPEPDGKGGVIELWRGRIVSVTTVPPIAHLGAVLYELGWIDTATLDATLVLVAKEKRRHGEILVERGAITAAQRDEALVEQACRKTHHFFSYPASTRFAFYDARPDTNEPAVLVDPLGAVWRGIREYPPEESVREVLGRYPTSALRVVNEGPLGRITWEPEERALIDELLHRPLTVAQMRALGTVPAPRVELIAYLLVVGKCAEPISPSQAGMAASPRAAPAPPPRTAPPMRTMATPGPHGLPSSGEMLTGPPSFRVPSSARMPAVAPPSSRNPVAATPAAAVRTPIGPADLGPTGIAARAQRLASESPFETLGLEDGASVEAVRAAYYRLAKIWHPDRLPADLEPMRDEAHAIFSQMAEAQRLLTDPDARQTWLASRGSPGAGGAVPAPPKRARSEVLRDIDTSLAKNDLAAARVETQRLLDADKDDPDAIALLAWIGTACGEANTEVLEASVAQLDRAVNTDKDCDRAYYYRGVLHKRLGMTAAAVRDFARALQLNPKHLEAAREVRIAEMRARKGSGEHALGLGITGKAKKK
jgi:hypothetical protein